jgi:microsomal epoxide hydrolase
MAALLCHPAFAAPMSGTVETSDITLHYLTAGNEDGKAPALVLIPGWSTDAAVWSEQIEHFSATRRVVAIDPRSQGESSKTPDGNTPEQRARDYEAVFTKLGLKRIILVGWSQGAQDVAAYVGQFGTARLTGLVLVDSAISKGAASVAASPDFPARLLNNIDLYAKHKRDYLDGMMHFIFQHRMSDERMEGFIDTALKTPTADGIAQLVADMLGADRTADLGEFDKPTLVIAAAKSFELEQQKAELALLPNARFASIGDAGHGVFIDQPQQFDQLLDDFIKGLSQTPATSG